MAIRKLYGTIGCPATMRVLASMFEHELEFEFIPIDLKAGEDQKEPILSLSPFGQVPVYQEEDLILFESRAIIRFISHHYPKPRNEQVFMVPKLQGIAAGWIDVEDHQFDPPATKLVWELVLKPKKKTNNGLPTANEAIVAEEEAKLGKVLDVYEQRLAQSKYLGGDKFTSADLPHLPNLYYLMGTPARRLFEERPCVNQWCSQIMARPAWAKVVMMVEKANALQSYTIIKF